MMIGILSGVVAGGGGVNAVTFTTQPTVTPSSGTAGQTFTATPGTLSNGSITSREWRLAGNVVSTALTYVSTTAGSLTYQEFAGSVASNLIAVTVAAPAATALPKSAQIVDQMSADSITQANNSSVTSLPGTKGVLTLITDPTNNGGTGRNPTYLTNRLNGKPSIKFDSTIRQSLSFGRPAALVSALNSTQAAMLFVFRAVGAPNTSQSPVFSNTTGNLDTWIVRDASLSGSYTDYIPDTQTGFQTMLIVKDTASSPSRNRIFLNGMPVAHQENPFSAGGSGDYLVGRGDNGGNGSNSDFFTNFELLDMVVWSGAKFTAVDGVQAHMWACDKYAQAYPWAGLTYLDVIAGDSIPAGAGYKTPHVNVYTNLKATRAIEHGRGLMTVAVPGISMAAMQSQLADDLTGLNTLTGLKLRIVFGEWANQAGSPGSSRVTNAQNVLNSLQSFRTGGGKIGLWNSTAYGGSGTGASDETATGVTSAAGTARVSEYGPGIQALTSLYDNFQNVAANASIGVIGACPYYTVQPSPQTNDFFLDEKHLSKQNAAQTVQGGGIAVLANFYTASFTAMP
jgi:hypothetical protein